MSTATKIEWTRGDDGTAGATWNPVTGCTEVSPGCDHCYAKTFAERWRGIPGHPFEQGFDLRLWPERLGLPLRWRKPRRVFVNSMSDLFHDQVPEEFIAHVWAVMAATPQHTYQLLTKRHGRMRALLNSERFAEAVQRELWESLDLHPDYLDTLSPASDYPAPIGHRPWPLTNVWVGVSAEDQKRADLRIPALLDAAAAVRFVSCEPLLGPLDVTPWLGRLDWLIVGGESGPGARPMHPRWARDLRDSCESTTCAYFFKQHGAWRPAQTGDAAPRRVLVGVDGQLVDDAQSADVGDAVEMVRVGKGAAGRLLDGRTWDEFPFPRIPVGVVAGG